ncbi:MAG: ATP-binding protein [Planctomycetes bacterium]|nr:ATP-binding protein [Planctomycetota bacterium]
MEVSPELKDRMKRLRLGGVLPTLTDRAALAAHEKLPYLDFLELVLSDEVERRDNGNLARRIQAAGFEEEWTVERLDWNVPVRFDRARLKDLLSLGFIERQENVVFVGPVGVGKTCWGSALGHSACRAGYHVLYRRSDVLLGDLLRARADHTVEREMPRLIAPDLLIVDDFALRRMDERASSDFYELVIERHTRASTIITSHRTVDEWVAAFDDPILANSALDRLAHRAHQIVIEGESLRRREAKLAGRTGVPSTRTAPEADGPTPENGRPETPPPGSLAARLAEPLAGARRAAAPRATTRPIVRRKKTRQKTPSTYRSPPGGMLVVTPGGNARGE